MALPVCSKITRFIKINKSIFHDPSQAKSFSSQYPKLKFTKQPFQKQKFQNPGCAQSFGSQNPKLKHANQTIKATNNLSSNIVERKLKITNNPNQECSIPISSINNLKTTQQNDLSPDDKYGNNEIPVIPSSIQPVTIRRKFAKSSTQNAITQPLKLPRLANPFPEPVKTLPSDTVSDDEKARLMQEEVKMEARFHLQRHQEMILQQKLNKMGQKQNLQLNNNKSNQQPETNQQMNFSFQQPQQMNTQEQEQPNFRKPKQYAELQEEDSSMALAKKSRKRGIDSTEQTVEDIQQKRPRNSRCRRKAHTRAARYLRHSWYPRGYIKRQMRKYSTLNSPAINPDVMTVSEECDLIIKRLKTLYPQYLDLKKPLFNPGSPQEKEFHSYVLKLIGKHRMETQIKRKVAPFPSYSEVKTFKCETRTQSSSKLANKDLPSDIKFNTGSCPRFYSTKRTKNKKTILVHATKNKCPKFKLQGYTPTHFISTKKNMPTKQEAPYPAFSEICDPPFEKEFDGRLGPWKGDVSSKPYNNNRHYATSAGDSKHGQKQEKQAAKKKPPCKNPFPPIPTCDYERQAEKNAERKKKKHCPKKKPDPCKTKSASPDDSMKMISKIRSWLNGYKSDADNIKVSRSPDDIDGRETYVIDVCEYEEVPSKLASTEQEKNAAPEVVEIFQDLSDKKRVPFENIAYQPIGSDDTHALEMTDPIPVQARNIPDFITQPSSKTVPFSKPEELKKVANKTEEQIPVVIKKYSVNEVKDNIEPKVSKIYYFKHNIKNKSFKAEARNMKSKPYESKINKVKPNYSKILTAEKENEVKASKINLVKESFRFKPNPLNINKVKKNVLAVRESKPTKSTSTTEGIKTKDIRLINVKHNIYSKFKDFKVNDIKEFRDIPLPEPCPIVRKTFFSPSNCEIDKNGCSKIPAAKCPKKKCRPKKKRKLPSCDDVKRKKPPTCGCDSKKNERIRLPIPGLEDKPQYSFNSPKKTYFKKSDNISNFIDVPSEDVATLANQKHSQKENFEPFKLKPQFWKR